MKAKYLIFSILSIASFPALQAQVTDATFGDIQGRQIGPAKMSGRISSITAENKDPNIVWVSAAGGGVWKSLNQGTTFKPVFEDYSQSIGTITIDQNHPDTVWVGTGEVWVRNSVSVGTGIYRTINGGEKWELKGLEKSERIGRILIDPSNPDIVYAAVLGALWGDSEDRGVYKTTDGGKTWTKLLYVNPSTGCADMVMDPQNPSLIYASMWDFRRQAYTFRSGGPGSALYKSTDGGATWNKIHNGFPNETLGRIAVAISPVAPHYLYALVESDKSALYRSSNQGSSWEKMSDQIMAGDRPFYYSLLVPDPVDSERIYKPGTTLWVSSNGGKIFQNPSVSGGAYHSDTHALWISPKDNRLIYMGTDGGVYISADKGNTWRFVQNLPVSQFYHVSVDQKEPYNVYGGLQDNGTWMAPSGKSGGIRNSDWKNIGFGDGFYAYGDPSDPDVTYAQYQGGRISRTNHKTGESKYIKPFPEEGTGSLRFNWNTPVVFGEKSGWLYVGSQYLFRSKDKGDSFERISPDLTTNDPARQKQEQSGGLTIDNSTAENNTTIFSINESPMDENIIWAGTDDGNIQLTTDGGKTWNKLNNAVQGIPPLAFISHIDADHYNKNAVWITVDAHRNGDLNPYVFYSDDLGKTWKSLVTPAIQGFCHVIKQDPVIADLIFLGTESGLFISLDHGKEWVRFKNKVPQTGVYDMAFQSVRNDLVLATHGRGIIIIDDLTALRNLTQPVLAQDFAFLPVRPYYFTSQTGLQDFVSDAEFIGPNPYGGASICYYLKKRHVFGEMYLEVYDSNAKFLKKLPAGNRKGINIVQIATAMEPPKVPKSPNILGEAAFGPEYQPGSYSIKVVKGTDTYTTNLVLNDVQNSKHTADDRKIQRETLMKAYNMLEKLAAIDDQILKRRDALKAKAASAKGSNLKKTQALIADCEKMHEQISATQGGEGGITGQVRLRENIGEIYAAVGGYRGRPTNLQIKALELYDKQVQEFATKIETIKTRL
ncbi:MAG: glycosyl hydrolase [Porphyromonadaceae bacterium]|nr:MAG: glycosyl hydrolase [Porphyromonadaceae bacterium]